MLITNATSVPDRVPAGGEQSRYVPPREQGCSKHQPNGGVGEEEGSDHMHAVEVVEPQVEMDRTCSGDEERRGPLCGEQAARPLPPGRDLDVLGHHERIRIAGHSGFP